jgi:hypothetical protein
MTEHAVGVGGGGAWRRSLAENLAGYEIILRRDPFTNWERNRMPESSAEARLAIALKILYADPALPLGAEFLKQSVAIADRALEGDMLASLGGFPQNRGRAIRTREYSAALLGGSLDGFALRSASADFVEWCRGYKKRKWDAQTEAYYLAAVRLLMMAADWPGAIALLATRDFAHHGIEASALRAIVEVKWQRRVDDLSGAHGLLSELSDPGWTPPMFTEWEILRLELAALLEHNGDAVSPAVDWMAALRRISR